MRRAPTGGYDFSRKRDYRRKVWATFRDSLKSRRVAIAEAHALLMPSSEGDEIDVAINAGFREAHLHVVDENPAIVATLKKRYPMINTYGVTTSRALERMFRNGVRLSCANFDFCGNVSAKLFKELGQTMAVGHGFAEGWGKLESIQPKTYTGRGVFADYSLVAVTLLRGREQSKVAATFHSDPYNSDDGLDSQNDEIEEELSRYGGSLTHCAGEDYFAKFRHLPEFDRIRLGRLTRLMRCDVVGWESLIKPTVSLKRAESYVSSNGQSMLWSVWVVLSPAETCAAAMRLNAIRKAAGLLEYGPNMFR